MLFLNLDCKLRICEKYHITEFCQTYFPEYVEAELWLEKHGHTLSTPPRKPFILTCDTPDFTERMLKTFRNAGEFEFGEDYEQEQDYRFDSCCYEFFSLSDISSFLKATRDEGIHVMAMFNRDD